MLFKFWEDVVWEEMKIYDIDNFLLEEFKFFVDEIKVIYMDKED